MTQLWMNHNQVTELEAMGLGLHWNKDPQSVTNYAKWASINK